MINCLTLNITSIDISNSCTIITPKFMNLHVITSKTYPTELSIKPDQTDNFWLKLLKWDI